MKVRDLIDSLNKIDPELDVVTKIDTTYDRDSYGIYYLEYEGFSVVDAWLHPNINGNTYCPYKQKNQQAKKLLIIK